MTQAWHIEALHRTKRLPALKSLLTKRGTKVQTAGQQRMALQVLSAQYGFPLRKAKRRRRRDGQPG